MTRYSGKTRDEAPDRKGDNARRRSVPADVGPASPAKIAKLYAQGKERFFNVPGGDGLVSKAQHGNDIEIQKPQFIEDRRQPDYPNQPSGWVRGQGRHEGGLYPEFDGGRLDVANKPQKPTGPRNTASGADMKASPFSAAHKTYQGK
jgi:hypothetical protein